MMINGIIYSQLLKDSIRKAFTQTIYLKEFVKVSVSLNESLECSYSEVNDTRFCLQW